MMKMHWRADRGREAPAMLAICRFCTGRGARKGLLERVSRPAPDARQCKRLWGLRGRAKARAG